MSLSHSPDWALGIALIALALSVANTYFSWRHHRLEINRASLSRQLLKPSLIHSQYRVDRETGDRLYAFRLIIRNPSDSRNAVSEADLAITYVTNSQQEVTTTVGASAGESLSPFHCEVPILAVPKSIPAHDTISGWLQFRVRALVLQNAQVESYRLQLCDTSGKTVNLEPILVQEFRDEV